MIDLEQLPAFFTYLREQFEKNEDYLNQLDSAIGDGDHGFTMTRALQAAEIASRGRVQDLSDSLDGIARAVAENAGGAMGPLLAAFFAGGSPGLRDKTRVSPDDFSRYLASGLEAVQGVGEAGPGDKTLIDALTPAVEALSGLEAADLKTAVHTAARAAQAGADRTAEMIASRGRASFTGARSLGHPDPGAASLALILRSLEEFLEGARGAPPVDISPPDNPPPPGKLINQPDLIVSQDNQGMAQLYPELLHLTAEGILVRSRPKDPGKVGLVIGHGGGHTPSMGGFVGPGLLDADVYGPVFTCASGISIARAIHAGDPGGGVVLLISNHSGDVLNARLALQRARQEGIDVEPVLLGDDIATAPRESYQERRGLGGLLFALKIGGAAAEAGASLQEVSSLMRKVNQCTATLSVAVKPPTHPATGQALFELSPGQIEIGTGVHGEVGLYRGPHLPADEIISLLLERLLEDLSEFQSRDLLVFINGAGGTSKTELHILYHSVCRQLESSGFRIAAGVADSLFTTQEMGGFSLSLCSADQVMLDWWQRPASGPCFRWPYQ